MKWIHLLALVGVLFAVPVFAQQTTTKTEKKVVITKKTIDADGNEMVETIEAEGDDADRLLREMEIDDMDDIDIDIDGDGEERFRFHFRGDGDEDTFEWNGLENMPEELEQMLEELNLEGRFQEFNFGDLGDMGDMEVFRFGGPMGGGNAVLGVQVENADAPGAQVMAVTEGSAAEKAGLEAGDIITAINGLEIDNANMLIQKMRKYEPQERIEVEVARNGKKKTMKVTLQARSY
ncbi:MAG: PDZ domain-containing protein [Bacteroidota bacterium]